MVAILEPLLNDYPCGALTRLNSNSYNRYQYGALTLLIITVNVEE